MSSEKRRYNRFPVDILDIRGKMICANTVEISDISVSGISIRTDKRLNIDREYMLKIEENGNSISVKGNVIWARLQDNKKAANGDLTPLYVVGMKFTDISSIKVRELISFIETHKQNAVSLRNIAKQSDIRLYMRFYVNTNGKTILSCHANYTVKKISMGGMLMESRTSVELDERLPMEFSLPQDSPIRFFGRVASCTPSTGNDAGYKIGIEFSDMSGEDRKKLQEFISKLDNQ